MVKIVYMYKTDGHITFHNIYMGTVYLLSPIKAGCAVTPAFSKVHHTKTFTKGYSKINTNHAKFITNNIILAEPAGPGANLGGKHISNLLMSA